MTWVLAQSVIYLDTSLAITSDVNDDGIADVLLYSTDNIIEAFISDDLGDIAVNGSNSAVFTHHGS